ncbi:FAD-dependent monooxygenase [Actinoplanes sp. N902-109]|uniref:FAD-dependent monooxygenase n=1 Tax=Actinoplanes sp. (strain N902-109) TaxID=649831 RepID=UPI000329686F|nr:FAD-dependent monooxygenase [Actinoplanes sp. N902-109]AGL15956.1 putative FAD-dependent oxygenase [Actinoplanes sp. N902-109]
MSNIVLIAGGGPTGLMLAGELALAGVPAVVIERRTEPAQVSQGMAIHGRTLEVFRQRGLTDRIPPGAMTPWPRTPFALLWLDLATVDERDYTYVLPQWRTEELLAARATELGVTIMRGTELVGCSQDDTGVSVTIRSAAGEEVLRAGYVVGCDGEFSVVRSGAGIGFPADGMRYYGVMGDVELEPGTENDFVSGVFPAGMSSAIPLRPGLVRLMTVEFETDRPDDSVPVTAGELSQSVGRITGRTPDIGEPHWVSRFGNHTRLADCYRKGRIFLAGDAAHVLFVSGTQGLNTGIQDAVNLGWKLAAAINGWAPPGLLDTYEEERRPVGRRVVTHARAQMALLHPVDRIAELRRTVEEFLAYDSVNQFLLKAATRDDYPGLGERITDLAVSVSDNKTTVGELLRPARGVLLDLSGGRAQLASIADGYGDRIDIVSAEPTDETGAAVLLLRPDGHVAHRGTGDPDDDGLRLALSTWFGRPKAGLAPAGPGKAEAR